ncbi:hypothetical protein BVX97_03545 [bacterium E08(2017)]|nr:hypothetical protein BVX97_03545 [bacterium E08(2017)]
MNTALRTIVLSVALTALCGCAAFQRSIEEQDPKDAETLSARYDQNDMLKWGDMIAGDIIGHYFIKSAESRPLIADLGIQNRTKEHLDMQSLADTITTRLLDSGRVRLVNTADRDKLLKEQGYQLANCTMATRSAIGKQLGAKYMMTGALIEMSQEQGREVRVSKKKNVYYQLTINITDLETGEIVMKKQRDRLRMESKPIIGW